MWRLYGVEKYDLRVQTTVGKLLRGLADAVGDWAEPCCFIGEIDYTTDAALKRFAKTAFKNGIDGRTVVQTLLKKRDAFEHEREVRLIYFEGQNAKHKDGVFLYPIDPLNLVDRVMAHPSLPYDQYKIYKEIIMRCTGLPEDRIKRSLLYSTPKDMVVELP